MSTTNVTRHARPFAAPAIALHALPFVAPSFASAADIFVPNGRAAVVSVRDLDLSTAGGRASARDRVHRVAQGLCARISDPLDVGHTEHYQDCVASATARAMEQVLNPDLARAPQSSAAALAAAGAPAADPITTRRSHVSLVDLDLTTPAGVKTAHERVRKAALRLCSQVADELDLSQQANFEECVDESMTSAQLRIQELAARKSTTPTLVGSNR